MLKPVAIRTNKGHTEVQAHVINDVFAIHRPLGSDLSPYDQGWTLTHIPTGLLLRWKDDWKLNEARAVAKQLTDVAWATLDEKTALEAEGKRCQQQLREALGEADVAREPEPKLEIVIKGERYPWPGFSSLEDLGYCIECAEEHYGIEPDARKYECENCGVRAVYGAEELLQMGYVE